MAGPDVYFSADVEADGPIPGPYSMSSVGVVVVGRYDGARLDRADADDPSNCFYAELRPISDTFDPEAAAVAGLDRAELLRSGQAPEAAMTALSTWVKRSAQRLGGRPVLVAYPASFDWMWLYWYFVRFASGGSPFGFSGVIDMKSYYAARSGAVLSRSTKRSMPKHLLSARPHTHHALDDAKEQADLMAALVCYHPQARPT